MDNKVQKLINNHKWDRILEMIKNGELEPKKSINNDNNIIHYASLNNNKELVKYLAQHHSEDFKYIDNNGQTPVHILASLGYINLLKSILNKDLIGLTNSKNQTLLHLLYNNHDFLIWADKNIGLKDIINIVDEEGMTVLTQNISNGKNNKTIDFLIGIKGIDINHPSVLPPLNVAIYGRNVYAIDTLLKHGANVNQKDQSYFSPLLLAVQKKLPLTVKKLIEKGADVNYTGPEGEHNPLIMAIKNNDEETMDVLLKSKFNFNKYDRNMDTPLHVALSMKEKISPTIIAKLLYFSDIEKKNVHGKTPLNMLKEHHNPDNYKVFIEHKKTDNKTSSNKIKKVHKINTNFGKFNSDSLHSMIYTMIILNRHSTMGVPAQSPLEDKMVNTKLNTLCNDVYKDPHAKIISDLVKIYTDYFFEILPYLIIWRSEDQYYVTPSLDYYLNKCMQSDKIRFIVIKLTLIVSTSGTHANIIIYDKKTRILERFEPYGAIPYLDPDKLDNKIKQIFKKCIDEDFEYYSPKDIMDNISFQSISEDGKSLVKKLGDPAGYCLAWTLWYLESRLQNPDMNPKELVKNHLESILEASHNKRKFIDFIRNYANRLDKEKNEYMLKAGIKEKDLYNIVLNSEDQEKIVIKLSKNMKMIIANRF